MRMSRPGVCGVPFSEPQAMREAPDGHIFKSTTGGVRPNAREKWLDQSLDYRSR